MSRIASKQWWSEYDLKGTRTGRIVDAPSEVVAKKIAYDNALEDEILLSVQSLEDSDAH